MADSKKKKYIEAAYQLLETEPPQAVSIRKVAERAGTSSAAIYCHFKNIDELVRVASFRFMQPYTEDARLLLDRDLNPLELNLQLWERLATYSFRRGPIFENLFFGGGSNDRLAEAATMYYNEYPEELENMPDYLSSVLKGTTLFERNAIILNWACEEGMISPEAAEHLCKLDCYLYRGMLAAACADTQLIATFHITYEFVQLLVRNYRTYLAPGYSIVAFEPEVERMLSRKNRGPAHTARISVIRS